MLGEVHRVHVGRTEVHMNDLLAAGGHEERWLFHHIMAHVDHQVGAVDCTVNEVPGRQGSVAQVARMSLIHHALAHLGGEERDAGDIHEMQQRLGNPFPVGAGTDHDQRMPGLAQHFARHLQAFRAGRGPPGVTGFEDMGIGFGRLIGDVLRQLQMHGTRTLFRGQAESFPNLGRNGVGIADLPGVLGERTHQVHHIQNLE